MMAVAIPRDRPGGSVNSAALRQSKSGQHSECTSRVRNRLYLQFLTIALAVLVLTSCAMLSRHQFIEPAVNWHTRNGQLLYRNARRSLIGEVLVRFSNHNEFELTFSKGTGVTLLTLRQDADYAEVKGALAGRGWSGPVAHAPPQLRGWLQARDKIVNAQGQQSVQFTNGTEKFIFRF